METFLFVLGWLLNCYLAIAVDAGFRYYHIYPEYPFLGTPDEQLKEDAKSVPGIIFHLIYGLFGPISLPVNVIIYMISCKSFNIKLKYKFW